MTGLDIAALIDRDKRDLADRAVIYAYHVYYQNKPAEYFDNFMNMALMYGFYRFARGAFSFCKSFFRRFVSYFTYSMTRPTLYNKYAKKKEVTDVKNGQIKEIMAPYQTWALLTEYSESKVDKMNKTDHYARYLASQGFNIFIMSNQSRSTLQKRCEILQNEIAEKDNEGQDFTQHLLYREFQHGDGSFHPPRFQTKHISVDFAKMDNHGAFLDANCSGVDVSLIVLNTVSNQLPFGPIKDIKDGELQTLINLNLSHNIGMIRHFQNKFEERDHQSGIICNTSILGRIPAAGATILSSASKHVTTLCHNINYFCEKIDAFSLETATLEEEQTPLNNLVWPISSEQAVQSSLRGLGETHNDGVLKQDLIVQMYLKMPLRMLQTGLYSASLNHITKIRAKEQSYMRV